MSTPLGKWVRWLAGHRTSSNTDFFSDGFIRQKNNPKSAAVLLDERPIEEEFTMHVDELEAPLSVDGMASLVDGRVFVTDPEFLGAYPVLSIPKGELVKVWVNGEEATGDCVLTSSSVVRFVLHHEMPAVSYRTSVSKDKLAVTLHVDIKPGVQVEVCDAEPSRKLIVQVRQESLLPEYSQETAHRLVRILEEQGFRGAIDYDVIQELAHATSSCDRVVLVGKPSFPGRAGRYKKVPLPTEVDKYLGKVQLATVPVGFCVGFFEPEVKGVPGQDVYGSEIPASMVVTKPALGEGVIAVNGTLVATRSGRVVFTKRLIDVVPERVIHGDVTARDGRVIFDGNVVVYGNVCDGSYVRAGGTITVKGGVFRSTIIGEKGVHIADNVVNSFVRSGFTMMEYARLVKTFEGLLKALQQFHREYVVMVEQAENRFNARLLVPRIAAVLFEQRHESLARLLRTLVDQHATELYDVDTAYANIIDLLRTRWQGIQLISVSVDDTVELMTKLETYLAQMESALNADPAPVVVKNVTAGSIRASGNIMVKLGMHSAVMESYGHLTIQGSARGGFIVSEKTIRIRELGSIVGVETSVRVNDENGMIIVGTCHANSLLEVAGQRLRTVFTEKNIRFGREPLGLQSVSNG